MIKILLLVTFVGACGGAGSSSSKTSSLTCQDAASSMAKMFESAAQSSFPNFQGRSGQAAQVTTEGCTSSGWSPGAIMCMVDAHDLETVTFCMTSGHGPNDKLNCPMDAKAPYGPGCTGFKKDQADAYREAMRTKVHCDLYGELRSEYKSGRWCE
ncbi:MAG: hypothetical protein IPQ07_26390 [Myxococcales bacterium]|nr:hypothetical protein [Myxococcales bacterium]